MRNNEKGITLVALVVTIIVLLILAGITITFALNGGILDRATQAKEATEIASIKDYAGFAKLNITTEYTLAKNGVKSDVISDPNSSVEVDVKTLIEKEFKGTGLSLTTNTVTFTPNTQTWGGELVVQGKSASYTVNMTTLDVTKQ